MSGEDGLSDFAALPDQEHPARILKTLLQKGTVPHALLFSGIEGTGKERAAVIFAMALNCSSPADRESLSSGDSAPLLRTSPCGRCASCGKIRGECHPDFIRVRPASGIIRIAQVRDLVARLALKPNEARQRVVLITRAHAMNKEAANALLKALEEPPARTVFILTATALKDLLPTIVSRCQHIRFNPVSANSIETLLREAGISERAASAAAAMADGSASKALALTESGWQRRRTWLLDAFDALDPNRTSLTLALAERLAQEKEKLPESLEILKGYLRDLLVHRYNPASIINRDLSGRIRQNEYSFSISSIISKTDAIQSAQRDLSANGNLRLILDVLVLRLANP